MAKRLDHVGVVVKDVKAAASLYGQILGLTPWPKGVVEDSQNGVRLLSLPIGDISIELLQPIKFENRFAQFLKERGEGLFHLCIFVEDFDKEIKALKEKGFALEEEVANISPGHPFRLAWLPPESTQGL